MSTAYPVSEYHAIRVVAETAQVVAVCLEGEFDCSNASALDAHVQLVLDGGNGLILDLSEASFIDCSIINVIMRAAMTARQREQAIVLQLGTAAIVERVLEIVTIEQVLPRAHDRQEALRMMQQQAPNG